MSTINSCFANQGAVHIKHIPRPLRLPVFQPLPGDLSWNHHDILQLGKQTWREQRCFPKVTQATFPNPPWWSQAPSCPPSSQSPPSLPVFSSSPRPTPAGGASSSPSGMKNFFLAGGPEGCRTPSSSIPRFFWVLKMKTWRRGRVRHQRLHSYPPSRNPHSQPSHPKNPGAP